MKISARNKISYRQLLCYAYKSDKMKRINISCTIHKMLKKGQMDFIFFVFFYFFKDPNLLKIKMNGFSDGKVTNRIKSDHST